MDRLWSDPNHWRRRAIYICKADPRVIVPKQTKWAGWTLNFAHASAWAALVSSILSIVLPTIYLALAGLIGTWVWYVFLISVVAILCGVSWVMSSAKWYEEAG
ncbi:MAG: hypothetical protein QOF78_4598 [Phycisphaerales bacterium]|nr:hypothetical protein [Phycisphaerales bacterium]